MKPSQLGEHRRASKELERVPAFKPLKRGKLPRPFNRMGGPRVHSTGLIQVGQGYLACFFYRDGTLLTDTHFLGYLMLELPGGELSPLFEFHWHPAHKGFHCKTPCRDDRDFTNRQLPGTRELGMKTRRLDPRVESERQELVGVVCRACSIRLGWENPYQGKLLL